MDFKVYRFKQSTFTLKIHSIIFESNTCMVQSLNIDKLKVNRGCHLNGWINIRLSTHKQKLKVHTICNIYIKFQWNPLNVNFTPEIHKYIVIYVCASKYCMQFDLFCFIRTRSFAFHQMIFNKIDKFVIFIASNAIFVWYNNIITLWHFEFYELVYVI